LEVTCAWSARSDARIDVVGTAFVVDQIRHRRSRGHVAEGVDSTGLYAESGAAKQVIDFRVELGHIDSRAQSQRRCQTAIVTTPSANVVAN
jgi:hypothetical protein